MAIGGTAEAPIQCTGKRLNPPSLLLNHELQPEHVMHPKLPEGMLISR
jgi:hypothetical protein